ncbi:MAG: CHAT domain-containing protein [bacterium]|nr:CHAT domain-containing protein [bacterium]
MNGNTTHYAELEIGLSRGADGVYLEELRFSHPESETEIPPLRGETPIDAGELLQHQLDPRAYGKALGEALFPDTSITLAGGKTTSLRAHYRRIETAVESGSLHLRLRLRLDPSASDLQALRWELLRDPESGDALAMSEKSLFSRFMASQDWRPVKLQPKSEPKALIAVSSPSDLGEGKKYQLAEVDADGEIDRARQALEGARIEVAGKDEPLTLDHLINRLRDGIDVLYLACHGAISKRDNVPALYLQNADGTNAVTRGAELATRLAELARPPRLAFLASCESAGTEAGTDALGEVTAQASLAPRLAEAGVSAIVAMQGQVSMQTVEEAVPVFFTELMKDGQIDRALAAARGRVRERHDAWMPALYTRLKSGRLWYVPGFAGVEDEFGKWQSITSDVRAGDFVPILGPDVAEHLYSGVRVRAQELAARWDYPMQPHQRFDLAKVSQFLSVRQSRKLALREVGDQLQRGIRQRHGDLGKGGKIFGAAMDKCLQNEDDPFHILAHHLKARVYVTASADPLLFQALKKGGRKPKPLYCNWRKTSANHPKEPPYEGKARREEPVVFYPFGVDRKDAIESLVLTEDDFLDYLIAAADYKLIPTVVRGQLVKSSLLFLGFPLGDLAFRTLFRLIMSLEGVHLLKRHAHVGVQVDPEEHSLADVERARDYLKLYFQTGAGDDAPSIDIYWGSAADFLRELRTQLERTAGEQTEAEEDEDDDDGWE